MIKVGLLKEALESAHDTDEVIILTKDGDIVKAYDIDTIAVGSVGQKPVFMIRKGYLLSEGPIKRDSRGTLRLNDTRPLLRKSWWRKWIYKLYR